MKFSVAVSEFIKEEDLAKVAAILIFSFRS